MCKNTALQSINKDPYFPHPRKLLHASSDIRYSFITNTRIVLLYDHSLVFIRVQKCSLLLNYGRFNFVNLRDVVQQNLCKIVMAAIASKPELRHQQVSERIVAHLVQTQLYDGARDANLM